jgi:hypothetical protein
MTSTQASNFQPLVPGSSDAGDFSSWLGEPVQIGSETFVMVQAGGAIASGSNGKQLIAAISGVNHSFRVTVSTGGVLDQPLVCGMIPSNHTGPIVSNSFFLALRDSDAHVAQVLPSPFSVVTPAILMVSTGGSLTPVFTAATTITSSQDNVISVKYAPSVALETLTAGVVVSCLVSYHAFYRGAD